MNVFLINQYSGNKGDRAVLYFIVRELIRKGIDDITVSTSDRSFWAEIRDTYAKEITYVPWGWNIEGKPKSKLAYRLWWEKRRFMKNIAFPLICDRVNKGKKGIPPFFCNKEFHKALKNADLVISTGGHHVTTRFFKDGTVSMIYDLMLVYLSQKPLILWSQTIGPLQFINKNKEAALRKVLTYADSIYVRDLSSINVLKEFQVDNPHIIKTYESVFGLNDLYSTNYILPSQRSNVVGITIYNAELRSADQTQKYVKEITQIVDHCITKGLEVCFFPHEMKGAVINDRLLINDIIELMKYHQKATIMGKDYNTEEHLKHVANCRLFIGHKTHSVIFALTMGTPLIAIAYHPKTKDFMKQFDLTDNCIDQDNLPGVHKKINDILINLDAIGIKQFNKSKIFRKQIAKDFSGLFD
ncbi:polysaccharide pyruvyl transferase family protein [Thermodesulfobacteriota bacterium]